MEEIKNIVKVASIYIATIIGAGFASGQEIMQFFSSYYKGGFYGIILAGLLFSLIGVIVLNRVYKERIRNYDEFLFPMVGWFIGWIMEIVVTLFMLSVFCIMIAGGGNIFVEKFDIPFNYGVVIMSAICMIFILTDIKGVVTISTFVTPVLIGGVLAVGLYIILSKDISVFSLSGYSNIITNNWFFSSLLYVSYNSIISVVVMCSLLPYLKTKRVCAAGGILGGIMLCLVAFILNSAVSLFYPGILSNEIPVLSIVKKYNGIVSNLYTIVLWLAMLVSAVTAGYCFIDRVNSKTHINIKLLTAGVCAIIIPLSSLGFSNLIVSVYPVFGYLGLFMLFAILFQRVRFKSVLSIFKRNK